MDALIAGQANRFVRGYTQFRGHSLVHSSDRVLSIENRYQVRNGVECTFPFFPGKQYLLLGPLPAGDVLDDPGDHGRLFFSIDQYSRYRMDGLLAGIIVRYDGIFKIVLRPFFDKIGQCTVNPLPIRDPIFNLLQGNNAVRRSGSRKYPESLFRCPYPAGCKVQFPAAGLPDFLRHAKALVVFSYGFFCQPGFGNVDMSTDGLTGQIPLVVTECAATRPYPHPVPVGMPHAEMVLVHSHRTIQKILLKMPVCPLPVFWMKLVGPCFLEVRFT